MKIPSKFNCIKSGVSFTTKWSKHIYWIIYRPTPSSSAALPNQDWSFLNFSSESEVNSYIKSHIKKGNLYYTRDWFGNDILQMNSSYKKKN